MKEVTKEVKTGKPSKTVGTVTIPIYENIDELIQSETEAVILERFNHANTIRIMSAERQKHVPGRIGKNRRMEIAYSTLTHDEAMSAVGDLNKLQDLLNSEDVQARVDEYLEEHGET